MFGCVCLKGTYLVPAYVFAGDFLHCFQPNELSCFYFKYEVYVYYLPSLYSFEHKPLYIVVKWLVYRMISFIKINWNYGLHFR